MGVRKEAFLFEIRMIWREQQNHTDDCYSCSCDVKGHNSKNKKVIVYPNLCSAIRPVTHGPDISIPESPKTLAADCIDSTDADAEDNDSEFSCDSECERSQLFTQPELNDLVRDLGLAKEKAELLGSRLQEKKFLAAGTSVTFYRNRDRVFSSCFSQEGDLVYCSDIEGLMQRFGIQYNADEWSLSSTLQKQV